MTIATTRAVTFADRVLRTRSLASDTLLVTAGAGLVGLAAQIAVPLWPVPITGQTLAVLLVGSALGSLRGSLALLLYAAAGVLGIPWFSDAASGWQTLAGPTGGYIIGFIAAAGLAGWFAERAWDRRVLPSLAVFSAGTALPFVFGLPWLALVLGLDLGQTLAAGLYPFIVGGVIKTALAAVLMPLAWRSAGRGAS
ncbi:biotin transporter BioY [Herbiconiux daphne]|uniref:Biotin transporter n=1 Tax=Herbiconiux daphne TaxID=2970914 RepID=A0ABT2H748_9MICO|nr:biotin transporter BioY [Herbiconiux daphne]MCS5735756.1 biotin transporter BioY [Herbiconiux daphne]